MLPRSSRYSLAFLSALVQKFTQHSEICDREIQSFRRKGRTVEKRGECVGTQRNGFKTINIGPISAPNLEHFPMWFTNKSLRQTAESIALKPLLLQRSTGFKGSVFSHILPMVLHGIASSLNCLSEQMRLQAAFLKYTNVLYWGISSYFLFSRDILLKLNFSYVIHPLG